MTQPGSIRNKKGNFSIWRVPNFFLDSRGYFLGGRVASIDKLNRFRSLAGLFLLACLVVIYTAGSDEPMSTTKVAADGSTFQELSPHAPGVTSLFSALFAVIGTALVVPLVGLGLVLWTRPGARLGLLRNMVWPVVALVSAVGVFLAPVGVMGIADALHLTKIGGAVGVLVALPLLAVGVVGLVWMFKTIYLAAAGMLRAEDAHPLLPIIAAPLIALWVLATGFAVGNDLAGVPQQVGTVFAAFGVLSIFVVSWVSARRLKRIYGAVGRWPLRNGPLRDLPPPEVLTA